MWRRIIESIKLQETNNKFAYSYCEIFQFFYKIHTIFITIFIAQDNLMDKLELYLLLKYKIAKYFQKNEEKL